jgi:hypothetical protein
VVHGLRRLRSGTCAGTVRQRSDDPGYIHRNACLRVAKGAGLIMFKVLVRSRLPFVVSQKLLPLRSRAQIRGLTCSMPSKKDDKYTDPELREEVKGEIQAGEKGGKSGQWSARKVSYQAYANDDAFPALSRSVVTSLWTDTS